MACLVMENRRMQWKGAVAALSTFVVMAGCASQVPSTTDVDPSTGVARPQGGSVPFYPGDISLQSVPSMPRAPKRDASRPMALWTEELIGRPGAHMFVRNDGNSPLRVAKVSVYECINIEGGCVDWDPNLVLPPGEKARLYTVVPLKRDQLYKFRWRAYGGPERAPSEPVPAPPDARNTAGQSSSAPGRTGAASSSAPPSSSGTTSIAGASFISDAKGNPLDTLGALITMSSNFPMNDRSVTSTPPAARFRSYRMRLQGDVDARNVTGGVTLWIKVQTPSGTTTVESSEESRVGGTKKGHIEVVTVIPATATAITLGARLKGSGDVTITRFRFHPAAMKK